MQSKVTKQDGTVLDNPEPKARSFDGNLEGLNIPTAQERKVLQRPMFVVPVEHPYNEGEYMDFVVRMLSPNDEAEIQGQLITRNMAAAAAKAQRGKKLSEADIAKVTNAENLLRYAESRIKTVFKGIIHPNDITMEELQEYSTKSIDLLYAWIDTGKEPGGASDLDEVDMFSDVDEGEEESSTDNDS